MTNLNHKDLTKWVRTLLKRDGVPATVRMQNICGVKHIQIIMNKKRFEDTGEWTIDELASIHRIAVNNNLTGARGSDLDHIKNSGMVTREQFDFEFHG